MPFKVCKLARASGSSICKELFENSFTSGYCAGQSIKCYGCKLHIGCSINGIIDDFDISKASVHDIHYLKDIKIRRKTVYYMLIKGICF